MGELQQAAFARMAQLREDHPRNVKCSVECDDGANAFCVCSATRAGEFPGLRKASDALYEPGGRLSDITSDMPRLEPARSVPLWRRIAFLAWRVFLAAILARLIAGVNNGVPYMVTCWLIVCVWLEIVSFRFTVTRR